MENEYCDAESIAAEAAKIMVGNKFISHFRPSPKNSDEDKDGVDIKLFLFCGLCLPLQVKNGRSMKEIRIQAKKHAERHSHVHFILGIIGKPSPQIVAYKLTRLISATLKHRRRPCFLPGEYQLVVVRQR